MHRVWTTQVLLESSLISHEGVRQSQGPNPRIESKSTDLISQHPEPWVQPGPNGTRSNKPEAPYSALITLCCNS